MGLAVALCSVFNGRSRRQVKRVTGDDNDRKKETRAMYSQKLLTTKYVGSALKEQSSPERRKGEGARSAY